MRERERERGRERKHKSAFDMYGEDIVKGESLVYEKA